MEPVTAIQTGLALFQGVRGIINGIHDKKDIADLMSQRKAYQTPDEIFKIVQAAQNNATSGYDANTLNYMTGETDKAFSSALGAEARLGGDPNDLSSLFSAKVGAIMKIGADNHAENMRNFSNYQSALSVLADNKAAEQKSQQDILKDKIAAKTGQANQDNQNVGNAINSGLGALAADQTMKLYQQRTNAISGSIPTQTQSVQPPANNTTATLGSGVTVSDWNSLEWH